MSQAQAACAPKWKRPPKITASLLESYGMENTPDASSGDFRSFASAYHHIAGRSYHDGIMGGYGQWSSHLIAGPLRHERSHMRKMRNKDSDTHLRTGYNGHSRRNRILYNESRTHCNSVGRRPEMLRKFMWSNRIACFNRIYGQISQKA